MADGIDPNMTIADGDQTIAAIEALQTALIALAMGAGRSQWLARILRNTGNRLRDEAEEATDKRLAVKKYESLLRLANELESAKLEKASSS